MRNGGYLGTDLKLIQNSKLMLFKFCFLEILVLGSNPHFPNPHFFPFFIY